MAIDTVLFDLDGTILNTIEDLCDSVNFALDANGFPTRTLDEVRAFVGNGVKNLIHRALPDGADEASFEKCLSSFKSHYERNKTNKTAPYDGVLEMMRRLKADGYKTAIVSNKHDDAVQGLFKLFFSDCASFALGNTDNVAKKPAPDMVYKALDALSSSVDRAIYIGDSEVDVETAKNSHIPLIGVSWGFRGEALLSSLGVRHIAHKPSDIPDIIKSL